MKTASRGESYPSTAWPGLIRAIKQAAPGMADTQARTRSHPRRWRRRYTSAVKSTRGTIGPQDVKTDNNDRVLGMSVRLHAAE
jgi:hypothetical protein